MKWSSLSMVPRTGPPSSCAITGIILSCMACANSSAPRATLLLCGGLDARFTRGNDLEFGMRLRRDGLCFKYQPSAVVHQVFEKTTADIVAEAEAEGRAALRLCRTCPD